VVKKDWRIGSMTNQGRFYHQGTAHTKSEQSVMLLAVSPRLLASLELRPRTGLGPLDLFDQTGQLAVAGRWWSSRPLGDHSFADENPRLFGAALLMRPDVFGRIEVATELKAFESLSIKVEQPEQRPNRR
jgi:hypothetical protein